MQNQTTSGSPLFLVVWISASGGLVTHFWGCASEKMCRFQVQPWLSGGNRVSFLWGIVSSPWHVNTESLDKKCDLWVVAFSYPFEPESLYSAFKVLSFGGEFFCLASQLRTYAGGHLEVRLATVRRTRAAGVRGSPLLENDSLHKLGNEKGGLSTLYIDSRWIILWNGFGRSSYLGAVGDR